MWWWIGTLVFAKPCAPVRTPLPDSAILNGGSALDLLSANGTVELPLTWDFRDGRAPYFDRTEQTSTHATITLEVQPGTAYRSQRPRHCNRAHTTLLEASFYQPSLLIPGRVRIKTHDGRLAFRRRTVFTVRDGTWSARVVRKWWRLRRRFRFDKVLPSSSARPSSLEVLLAGNASGPTQISTRFHGKARGRLRRRTRRQTRYERRPWKDRSAP